MILYYNKKGTLQGGMPMYLYAQDCPIGIEIVPASRSVIP